MLGHHVAIGKDVAQLCPVLAQNLPDEQTPMAILRLAAAAHQAEPVRDGATQDALDASLEGREGGHRRIERVPVGVVVVIVVRTAAERIAQEEVADAAMAEEAIKLLAVEMRRVARVRVGPHVDDVADLRVHNEIHKAIRLVVGMSDGPQDWRSHALRIVRTVDDRSRVRSPA